MRPLRLTVSGLNSFKEEQVIDFAKLSDLGIFGIFGPTGSGKSSILDAITLALYGTVVRAERGKQGIINQAVAKLNVSFTFALGHGELRQVYRIERSYKTKDHVSVQSVHSRFIELNGVLENIVAERENEVNRYAEKLLGLTVEDFTRAVVLPQGSFADFLKMDGSKRRIMLERLFRLEKYGRQLSENLNKRLEVVNRECSALEGEQKGLGEASDAALAEAEQQKIEAGLAEQQAVRILDEMTDFYEKSRKIYEIQQEICVKEKELAAHQSRQEEITRLELAMQRAELAKQVKPMLADKDELTRLLVQATKEVQSARQQEIHLKSQDEVLAQELQRAQSSLRDQEPKLIARQTQLEAAEKQEREVNTLQDKLTRLAYGIGQTEGSLGAVNAKLEKSAAGLIATQTEIARLEKDLAQNTVASAYRQQVQSACSQAESLQQALKTLQDSSTEIAKRRNALAQVSEKLGIATENGQKCADELAKAEQALLQPCPYEEETLYERSVRLAELKTKLEKLKAEEKRLTSEEQTAKQMAANLVKVQAEAQQARIEYDAKQEELTALKDSLRANDRRTMAITLAGELAEGQACPVCGATHHPLPAYGSSLFPEEDTEKETLQAEIRGGETEAEKLLEQLRQREEIVIRCQAQYEAASNQVSSLGAQLNQEITELAKAWQLSGGPTVDKLWDWGEGQQQALAADKAGLAAWKQARSAAEEDKQNLEARLSGLTNEIAAYRTARDNAQTEVERAKETQTRQEKLAGSTALSLNAVLCELDLVPKEQTRDNISLVFSLRAKLAEADQKAEALQRKLQQRRQAQQEQQIEKEALQAKLLEMHGDLSKLQSQHHSMSLQVNEKQEDLNRITKGHPAAVLLTQLKQALKEARDQEQSTREAYDSNRDALFQLQQKITRESTTLEGYQKRFDEVEQHVTRTLAETGFDSASEVQAAYVEPELFAKTCKEIDTYKDEERKFLSQLQELQAKRIGQSIDNDTWETLQQKMAAVRQEKEDAAENRIRRESAWQDIAKRHEQWKMLEIQLAAIREDLRHLTTLKTLTRGNMLVEFMAQEQMNVILVQASDRLKTLTNNRYALEMASDGSFLIRDDDNGGARRPVNMLSGGETFQTSLALALALSSHIQLRGQYPLEFFFLDEGFGSLDAKALEVVMSSLERLPFEHMVIGLISHVGALQQRLLRRLIVEPAEANGQGSRVTIEIA